MAETGVPGQAEIQWGQLLLTLLVGGVLTAICFILGWWWMGTLFMLLTLFVACFAFPSLLYPLVFTLFAMFAIGWLAGARLDVVLHRGGASAWWRDLLSVLGGLAIGVAVPAFFWFVLLFVSAKWLLGLPETHKVKWGEAFAFVAARTFGVTRPYVEVENGKIKIGPARGLFPRFANPDLFSSCGGPGTLVVGEGNVVVLERGGKLSRILGEGTYALQRNEWFKQPVENKGIHDLRGGGGPAVTIEKVLTKDSVPIDIKISGRCRLELKEDTDKRPDSRYADGESSSAVIGEGSQYPIYRATILKAVYKTGDSGWKTAFPGGAEGPLREAVAGYTLDEIIGMSEAGQAADPDQRVIQQIVKKVNDAVGQKPLGRGLIFGGLNIQEIIPPKKTQEEMEKRWAAPIVSRLLLEEARVKREQEITKSEGRAASIRKVEAARHEASDTWEGFLRRLKALLPRIDEDSDVARQFTTLVQDLLLRVGDDAEEDLRRYRRAQQFMREQSQFGPPMASGRFGMQPNIIDNPRSPQDPQSEEPNS